MATTVFNVDRVQHEAEWATILQQLPDDLDASAFRTLALLRKRAFRDAATLLRLILAYACGLSMPLVTAWAARRGLVTISPEDLCGRLKQAHAWLEALVVHLLTVRAQATPVHALPLRLRLIDGTHVARPGATGTDWRGHLCLDLRTQRLDAACLTDETQGESFTRFTFQPGDVVLGDRNFGTRTSLWAVIQLGAAVLVRIIWQNFPLQEPTTGAAFPLWAHLDTLEPGTAAEWGVQTKPTRTIPALPGRLIAYRLSAAEAARAGKRYQRRRQRSQEGPPAVTTVAGWSYVLLFTTLSASLVPTSAVLALYRLRWQIEMAIKRYKSLCGLADLHTRLTDSCRTVLWAKLLLILLVEDLGARAEVFSP